ncbi:MAG: hypothetical protein PHH54_06660 [Candidatus Nanoarchaeia archaeon]|nr:hypothetical protein [Candidatus Nanoarchaeia archaeon]MDD5741637.1 hypothetical protein [Candidatus Nanoarchaeia archaeon]
MPSNKAMLAGWKDVFRGHPIVNKAMRRAIAKKTNLRIDNLKDFNALYSLSSEVNDKAIEEILACYTLGELIGRGVSLYSVFKITGDKFMEFKRKVPYDSLYHIHNSIEKISSSVANPMNETKLFSPVSVYLANIGEITSSLDSTLKKTADVLESKIEYGINDKEIGTMLFAYGFKKLFDAGLPPNGMENVLRGLSENLSIGPAPEVIKLITSSCNLDSLESQLTEINKNFERKYSQD